MKPRQLPLFLALVPVVAVMFLTEARAEDMATAMARKLVIHCVETGGQFNCEVMNTTKVPGAPPEPQEPVENLQSITVGFATGKEAELFAAEGADNADPDRHLKHCWVQLPSGEWQLYHC